MQELNEGQEIQIFSRRTFIKVGGGAAGAALLAACGVRKPNPAVVCDDGNPRNDRGIECLPGWQESIEVAVNEIFFLRLPEDRIIGFRVESVDFENGKMAVRFEEDPEKARRRKVIHLGYDFFSGDSLDQTTRKLGNLLDKGIIDNLPVPGSDNWIPDETGYFQRQIEKVKTPYFVAYDETAEGLPVGYNPARGGGGYFSIHAGNSGSLVITNLREGAQLAVYRDN